MRERTKYLLSHKITASLSLIGGLIYSLSPWASAATALLFGVLVALVCGNPYSDKTRFYAQKLLAYSIIGLGAGMNLIVVLKAGLTGLGMTVFSIAATLALGLGIGRLIKSSAETSVLISVGTAICGGSAIAAVAPVMKAQPHSISVALGTVFLLNALALFIFPPLGHYMGLTQHQFGVWSALAIHDTSSVVGAGLLYGPQALQTGVTIKLVRALWIVPLTLGLGAFYRSRQSAQKENTNRPWFILGFLLVAAFFTWMPQLQGLGHVIESIAKKGLTTALFLIGINLTPQTLKTVGVRPLLQGVILWLIVSACTLAFVKFSLV